MHRIAHGDRAAFKELYLLYHRRLARFLTRLTTRYDVAEEVINDTFWVVWQRAADFRGASQVSTWIMGIAYRRGLKTLRSSAAPAIDARPGLGVGGRGALEACGNAGMAERPRSRGCRSSSGSCSSCRLSSRPLV